MRKSLLISSICCFILGGMVVTFSIYFEGNAWSIAALVFIYFFGINTLFLRLLDDKIVRKLSIGALVPVYGTRFWVPIATAFFVSGFSAFFFLANFEKAVFSAIHFGLGLMAMLTAFISPKFSEVEASESLYPEYDVFE